MIKKPTIKEIIPDSFMKCGYCGMILTCLLEDLPSEHNCFKNFNQDQHIYNIDDKKMVVMMDFTASNFNETTNSSLALKQGKNKIRKIINDNNIDIALIKEIKARPQLYNKKEKISQARTNILWKDISDALRGKYSANDAKAKWKYLKDTYIRRKKENAVCWQSQHLTFLDIYIHEVEEDCNTDYGNSEDAQTSSTSSSNISCFSQQEKRKPVNRKKNELQIDSLSEMEKFVSAFVQQTPQMDSTDGFCMMFADLLRQLPEDKRSTVQLKIWQKLEALVKEYRGSTGED